VQANERDREHLKRLLEDAFVDAARPASHLLTADASLEASVIRNYLAQRTWLELDDIALQNYDTRGDLSALPFFLSSSGFVYFLPALLLFVADRRRRSNLLVDTLLAGLRKHATAVKCMSPTQQAAVDFALSRLELLYSDDPPFLDDLRATRAVLSG
jgi:hypothetical protein